MKQWYIAIAVAIIYLAISLMFHAWSWSWIIWVTYALYRFTFEEGRLSDPVSYYRSVDNR